jgi:hypothetical protein
MGGRLFSQRAKRPLVPVVGGVRSRAEAGRCEQGEPGASAAGLSSVLSSVVGGPARPQNGG